MFANTFFKKSFLKNMWCTTFLFASYWCFRKNSVFDLRCMGINERKLISIQWWQSSLYLQINNTPLPKREAHLPWQNKVRGQAVLQNNSLELVDAQCLARWHFNRCLVTTWVMWVKASHFDHLSTVGKYGDVNPAYSLTLSLIQNVLFAPQAIYLAVSLAFKCSTATCT